MSKYKGKIETNFFWLIPILIGFSKSNIDNKANVYAIHLTPFFEIGFNFKKSLFSDKSKEYIKSLSWTMFSLVIIISILGSLLNENVKTFTDWLVIQLIIGLPLSIISLFVFKD